MIRMLVDKLDTLDKAQKFRVQRLQEIKAGNVWHPMSEGPYVVVHWLPISDVAMFDRESIQDREFNVFIRIEGRAPGIPNEDGIQFRFVSPDVSPPAEQGKPVMRLYWNAQIFRSGALEMAIALYYNIAPQEKTKWIREIAIVRAVREAMDGFCNGMRSIKFSGRVLVGVSVIWAKNCGILSELNNMRLTRPYSVRDDIIVIESLIDNFQNDVKKVEDIERPILNRLCQSFGLATCSYYDGEGMRMAS